MAKKQEAVKTADRLMAYLEINASVMTAENRRDHLVAVSVLRQVAAQALEARRSFCRKCKEPKCGRCFARWVQGLIGEKPPKLRGEDRK